MDSLQRTALLFLGVLVATRAQNAKPGVPRLKLSYQEMLESNNLITFTGLANSSSYHIFVLDEERSRLYVGAKDHIFSFNLVNIKDFQKITWPVTHTRRDECKWAGKDIHRECANFIKVLKVYNQTHLYACGTGAFHPLCTYIQVGRHPEQDKLFKLHESHLENGRGKSPYDPRLLTASLLIDGELYSGTAADFMGRDFAIFRTLGRHHPIRTEQHDSRWLNDPRFIGVHLIPESDNPEDDKIYFFFRENAIDGEHSGKATHARIGQICKNDFGGHRSLVNKWTTFLKARLICSVQGPNGIDTHFDELQDVFLMNSKDPKNPVIYGVFTTSSNIFKGSAVCMYSLADVRRVFLGPYAHRDGPNYQWYHTKEECHIPGQAHKTFGGFDSTKDLPDDVIMFARSHPAMYNPVFPINNRPIIIKTDVNYQFTQLVVDRVDAEDGQYDVMFIGTDVGTVLKVVSIPKESWHDLEEVVLEEMTVFWELTSISAMEISTKQQQLYISSSIGVSQIPLHRCDVYGKACAECCLARDPYCAWDGSSCSRYFPTAKRRTRRQDIRNGDPLTHCSDLQHHAKSCQFIAEDTCLSPLKGDFCNDRCPYSEVAYKYASTVLGRKQTLYKWLQVVDTCNDPSRQNIAEKIIYGVENSSTFLECSPKSQRALVYWQLQKQNEERKDEIKVGERLIKTEQGLLLRSLHRKDSGIYYCHAVEHGFMQTLLKVTLEVIDTEHLEELLHKEEVGENSKVKEPSNAMTPNQKVWYRDFMQLINHPNLNTMDEFCEQVWKRDRKQRRQKPANAQGNSNKWKHLQENKKGRNRRTHEFERAPRSV